MSILYITRGLPASGKTSWARTMLATRPLGSIVRLNRDDLRWMGLDAEYRQPVHTAEQRISTLRDAALSALLGKGCDVIVDDTNLRAKFVRELILVARRAGAEVEFVDFTDIPLDECIRRDALRTGPEHVGEAVIRGMHQRFLAQLNGKPLLIPELSDQDAPAAAEPYVAPADGEPAVMVDLDGTVALLDRSPYDETLVHTDRPNAPVIETVRALSDSGLLVVFMSGRTVGCQRDTREWLLRHVVTGRMGFVGPYMREVGDGRPDHVVKLELFNKYVRPFFDVRAAVDDRDQVVRLWRSMGLTCLQVADGAF